MSELPDCCAGRCPCHELAFAWSGGVDCKFCGPVRNGEPEGDPLPYEPSKVGGA